MHVPLPHRLLQNILCSVGLLLIGSFFYTVSLPFSAAQQTIDCQLNNTICTVRPDSPYDPVSLDVTVSGSVLETALELKGYAPPGAFILVSDSGDIIGATTAQANGTFDMFIHALQGGSTHALSLYAANGNQVTPSVSFVVTVAPSTLTTVDNILLPTFLDVDPLTQNAGLPIHVMGDTVPGATVTVYKESPLDSVQTTADLTGHWDIELLTEFGVLPDGLYKAYAGVTYNSYIAPNSRQVQFEVKPIPSTTKLVVNGYGPPGAFLSFKDGTTVVGNGIVGSNGVFSQTIVYPDASAPVDLHIVADNGSQISPSTDIATSVTIHTTTIINDVLLPTFIDVSPLTAEAGDPITVSGVGAPNASVELVIASPTQIINTTIDPSGNWSSDIIAALGTLPEGTYSAVASLTMPGGLQSVNSRVVTFQVTEATTATSLEVSGYAAPNAFLTFTENHAVVGTTVVSSSGTFDVSLPFPDVSLSRTISIVGDNGSQQTPATTFTSTITAFSQTTVANIVIPTFINVTPLKVPFGQTVMAVGTAYPGSTVRLFVQSPLVSTDLTAGATNGAWISDLNGAFGQLQKGTYTAYARVYVGGSYQSNLSQQITFEVIDADACADRRSDLNCDGKVDITDVGILIYYWGEAGAGQKADINKDGIVDVSDVGIMVYDWTY